MDAGSREKEEERPLLLTAGLVLTGLHAALMLTLASLGTLAALGFSGLVLAAGPAGLPVGVVGLAGAAVLGLLACFYVAILFVCWKSWHGERTWLWVLIAGTCLGLLSSGPLSFCVGVVTLIGAAQALDRAARPRTCAPQDALETVCVR